MSDGGVSMDVDPRIVTTGPGALDTIVIHSYAPMDFIVEDYFLSKIPYVDTVVQLPIMEVCTEIQKHTVLEIDVTISTGKTQEIIGTNSSELFQTNSSELFQTNSSELFQTNSSGTVSSPESSNTTDPINKDVPIITNLSAINYLDNTEVIFSPDTALENIPSIRKDCKLYNVIKKTINSCDDDDQGNGTRYISSHKFEDEHYKDSVFVKFCNADYEDNYMTLGAESRTWQRLSERPCCMTIIGWMK